MLQTRNQNQPKVDQLQEVAVYLRRADKLVKNGNYSDALEEIQKARTYNPKNLYALAYEERVRSIISAQKNKGESSSAASSEDLEKISDRAIAEAQRSADVAAKRQQRIDKIKQEEEAAKKLEEQQRTAIRKKVYDLLLKAREYHSNREYNRALDEIARIHMIDPSNSNATELEERIRADQDASIREAEAERKRKQQEEENRRKEYLKSELERIKREDEEKKRKEEEARQKAQKQKVQQHLKRARKLCDDGYLDDALAELAFVVVIDPLHEEVLDLEQRIREMEEEQQATEIERLEREKHTHNRSREETQSQIQKHIRNAKTFMQKNEFSDALRVISSAYVIDPLNEELQECEAEIIKARDAYLQAEEEKKRKQEEAQLRKQEEEMRELIKNAQERARSGEGVQQEEKRREAKERIASYLAHARSYLKNEQYESALGEVALAFVIDPFDEDISKLEQEIIDAQNKRRTRDNIEEAKQKSVPEQTTTKRDKEDIEDRKEQEVTPQQSSDDDTTKRAQRAARHIAEARRLKKQKEYHKARNELTKAFMLDPLNDELSDFEQELQQEYAKQQEEAKRLKATRAYANRAKQYLAQENFAKALEELETGLKSNPGDQELIELKKRIQEAEKRWREVEELWEKVSTSDHRSMRSGNPNSKNQYKEALTNYYAKLEETGVKSERRREEKSTNGKVKTKKEKNDSEVVDIEEEIRKVYESWRQEQQEIERGEREAKIQGHIKRSRELLKKEVFDEALAEIAYAKMIDDKRKDLEKLEKDIWNTWNEKSNNSKDSVNNTPSHGSDVESQEERNISLRIHVRAAEEFAEKKEYTKALDEITKAYLIDPLNEEVARLDKRIRHLQGKGTEMKQLKLVYPSAKVVGGY